MFIYEYYQEYSLYARVTKIGKINYTMKIGLYDPYLDDAGGGEKYMLTIAECLSNEHDVTVFWDNAEDLKAVAKRFSLDLSRIKLGENIFSASFNTLRRAWKTRKYDAIIILSDGSIPLSLSKKLFVHIQQPLPRAVKFSWKDTTKLSRITRLFYNSVYTMSSNEGKFPGVASMVLYPPVSLVSKHLKKENIILHVGRFRVNNTKGEGDYKKQAIMVDAFKEMADKKQISDWKLIIASSVQEKDMTAFDLLRKSAKGYPIEFLVNQTNDALWEIYGKAKIYWHASGFGEDLEKHPEYAEHFGISTVEAMGAGAVPVVINSGGQKEIVTDGKNGLLWNTLLDLQQKTKLLMDDEPLWTSMSKEALIRSKDFSKEKFCEEVNTLVSP